MELDQEVNVFQTPKRDLVHHDSSDDDYTNENSKSDILDYMSYVSPPLPLLEKEMNMIPEVNTAFKLNFKKLPSFNNPPKRQPSMKPAVNVTFQDDSDSDDGKNDKKDQNISYDPNGKTLFSLYPRGDPREVYRKFLGHGDYEPEPKMYAAYLIDLNKILKNKTKVKAQYVDIESEPPYQAPSNPDSLEFNSVFESGNLYAVYKISNNEYDLILQYDINSKGNTQWFFFSVGNTKKDQEIKFNIINMLKSDSMFNYGMQPAIYSTKDEKGWVRGGHDISYYKNAINREPGLAPTTYYSLTFKYKFKNEKDLVYFAQCYPYTYSDLKSYLSTLFSNTQKKK